MTLPTNASEVPQHIIDELYVWMAEGDIKYVREAYVKGDLISLHTLGGGMQIRNFLRSYPNEIDLDDHWLDDNWMEVIKRMFNEHENVIPVKQKHEYWEIEEGAEGTVTFTIPTSPVTKGG